MFDNNRVGLDCLQEQFGQFIIMIFTEIPSEDLRHDNVEEILFDLPDCKTLHEIYVVWN